jgi:N-acyl homoserine lactone hydrolase
MRRTLTLLMLGACANAFASMAASAQGAPQGTPQVTPEVTLTRLECGTPQAAPPNVAAGFSDTFAYNDLKLQLVFSCYLVKHGDDYMIWDTGFGPGAGAVAPKASLMDLLAQLKVKPDQVKFVGISHSHGDHIGQVGSFPQATLLIGKGDWDVLTGPSPPARELFTHWISGGGKVEPVLRDQDVFGDGTVAMLNTPGHTPGHHSLLVRLRQTGNVLLSGDLAHFHENYEMNGVPTFNTDRAQTLASLDRFKKIAANLKATVIIQHDERDIGKLPPFPGEAK